MEAKLLKVKERLDLEVGRRNNLNELSGEKPDPLQIAKKYRQDDIALICSLFAYGNAKLIVKFLDSLDFSLLSADDEIIEKELSHHYYRFQKSEDIIAIFIALKRFKQESSLEEVFTTSYKKDNSIMSGISATIKAIHKIYPHETQGYTFLLGKPYEKLSGSGAYKRWHMFLRWMVREDALDMGLWKDIDKSDLIIPLDTHTFNVALKLGLLKRKTYDLKAAIELTETLKRFDKNDPIKYDFALYRIGQEKIL